MATGNPTITNMLGKRCLVTGSTSGIGLETAKGLAARGADVTLVSRSEERCRQVAGDLQKTASGKISFQTANLADPESIQKLVGDAKARYDRLDVLVNNAGAMYLKRQQSVDGFELTWALNHLGYFRLTCGLLPLLKAAPAARVVSVASDAHRAVRKGLNWDDLHFERTRYRPFGAYCQSKLANILFTAELNRRVRATGIKAYCLHPGFVASNFFAWPGVSGAATRAFANLFAISPVQGAQTPIYLATSPEVEKASGGYYQRCKLKQPSRPAQDESAAKRLWELSTQVTGLDV